MNMNNGKNPEEKKDYQDILYLEGLFFIRETAIKENSDLVKNTLQDLYKNVAYN